MSGTTRRLLPALLALLPAFLVSAPGALAVNTPHATLHWRACDNGFQCATVRVPLSYRDPSSATIPIALARLPATGHAKGDLLLNPGGPGASGIEFVEGEGSFPAAVRAHYNLVGFDPRGVGRSDPVHCLNVSQLEAYVALNPQPTTPAQIATVINAVKAFDQACVAHTSAALLANVSTLDEAQDLDRIRAALGDAKLDYLGFSYGTYLGALYAQQFPSHVGALVLDAAFDPSLTTAQLDAQQASGFEADLHSFFSWCDKNSTCHRALPTGAAYEYERLMGALASGHTIRATLPKAFGGNQQVTFGEALTGVVSTLYSTQTWSDLGQALGQAMQNNATGLAEFAFTYSGINPDGSLDNLVAANIAINCLDRPSPVALTDYEQLAATLSVQSPDFGPSEAWSTLPCVYWPDQPVATPGPLHVAGTVAPILVVGSTEDPATPYEWAQALAAELPNSELLTRTGAGHSAYFASSCIQRLADAYLLSGSLPKKGTVCPSS